MTTGCRVHVPSTSALPAPEAATLVLAHDSGCSARLGSRESSSFSRSLFSAVGALSTGQAAAVARSLRGLVLRPGCAVLVRLLDEHMTFVATSVRALGRGDAAGLQGPCIVGPNTSVAIAPLSGTAAEATAIATHRHHHRPSFAMPAPAGGWDTFAACTARAPLAPLLAELLGMARLAALQPGTAAGALEVGGESGAGLLPTGALLVGPPGSGKTTAARLLAWELACESSSSAEAAAGVQPAQPPLPYATPPPLRPRAATQAATRAVTRALVLSGLDLARSPDPQALLARLHAEALGTGGTGGLTLLVVEDLDSLLAAGDGGVGGVGGGDDGGENDDDGGGGGGDERVALALLKGFLDGLRADPRSRTARVFALGVCGSAAVGRPGGGAVGGGAVGGGLVRSGRLERRVELPPPSAEDRADVVAALLLRLQGASVATATGANTATGGALASSAAGLSTGLASLARRVASVTPGFVAGDLVKLLDAAHISALGRRSVGGGGVSGGGVSGGGTGDGGDGGFSGGRQRGEGRQRDEGGELAVNWADVLGALVFVKPSELRELDVRRFPKPTGAESSDAGSGDAGPSTHDAGDSHGQTTWPSAAWGMAGSGSSSDAVSWASFGGFAGVKRQVQRAVTGPWREPGLFQGLGVKPLSGALLHGPPGCGKSLLAAVIAAEGLSNFVSVRCGGAVGSCDFPVFLNGPARPAVVLRDLRPLTTCSHAAPSAVPPALTLSSAPCAAPAQVDGAAKPVAGRVGATAAAPLRARPRRRALRPLLRRHRRHRRCGPLRLARLCTCDRGHFQSGDFLSNNGAAYNKRRSHSYFSSLSQKLFTFLLFDSGKRDLEGGGGGGRNDLSMRLLTTFLSELDGVEGGSARGSVLVLGATSRKDALDPALLRPGRLSETIFLGPPASAADRRAVLAVHAARLPLEQGLAEDSKEAETERGEGKTRVTKRACLLARLADETSGFTCADLAALCRDAALGALRRHLGSPQHERGDGAPLPPVTAEDFDCALRANGLTRTVGS